MHDSQANTLRIHGRKNPLRCCCTYDLGVCSCIRVQCHMRSLISALSCGTVKYLLTVTVCSLAHSHHYPVLLACNPAGPLRVRTGGHCRTHKTFHRPKDRKIRQKTFPPTSLAKFVPYFGNFKFWRNSFRWIQPFPLQHQMTSRN